MQPPGHGTDQRGRALLSRWGQALAAPLVLACVLTGFGPAVEAPAASCQNWTGVQPPSNGTDSVQFLGVAVLPGCDVWAVGDDFPAHGRDIGVVEHWNGSAWSQVPSPNPGAGTFLTGVHAVSPADIWAVGAYTTGTEQKTLTLHWNGKTWMQVRSPSRGQLDDLNGVHAVSANDVWAVGDFGDANHRSALILHWNGSSWRQVASPTLGTSSELIGVAAASHRDAWAVGDDTSTTGGPSQTLILHWNGKTWQRVSSPHPRLSSGLGGIGVSSASNAWAVGSSSDGTTSQTLALHWNGRRWAPAATPNPASPGGNNGLDQVTVISASDAWAVGSYFSGHMAKTLAVHWNGIAWTQVPSPNPNIGNQFFAVAASSAHNVWAVGTDFTETSPFQALAIHCC